MAKIVPVVLLAAHAKSSTLYGRSYGRTVVRPNFFGLMGYYYFELRCARLKRCELRYYLITEPKAGPPFLHP